jgi:glucose-6-phosphate dehydrogenase assembly protein OpcA
VEEAVMDTVAPEKILKELAELWTGLGKQGEAEGGQGVLRACTMTLVAIAEASENAPDLDETLAALMAEHPARAIVIRLSGAGERALSERVHAQCWMPFGQRRQICCEQVEITASDAALPDLPSVVLPLAVPDLPLILWCRRPRVFDLPEFRQLADMAARVVVDSGGFSDPPSAIRRLAAEVARPGPPIGDLAWTYLTRWREMLSEVFENRQNLERLAGVVRVRVSDGGSVTTRALYFAAWVKDGLEALGAQALVSISRTAATFVEVESQGFTLRLERQDQRMITTIDGVSQCTNLPAPSDYLLMREELAMVQRDPVFEQTLASAARLAYATD